VGISPTTEAAIFALLAEHTSEAAALLDSKGRIQYANPTMIRLLGRPETELLGSALHRYLAAPGRAAYGEKLAGVVAGRMRKGRAQPLSLTVQGAEGLPIPVRLNLLPVGGGAGVDVLVLAVDVSEQMRLLRELEASRASYAALSETVTDPILQINEALNIVFANAAVKSVFGYGPEELLGKELARLFPAAAYGRYVAAIRRFFVVDHADREASQMNSALEVLGLRSNEEVVPVEISFGNSRSVHGERLLTCIVRDVTQRKKTERKLRYLAYHDKLTDLGNRDLFYVTLEQYLANVKRYHDTIGALLFLDLDGFKKINDTLGHNIGDAVLCACARRLSSCLRESDYVYRFGREMESVDPGSADEVASGAAQERAAVSPKPGGAAAAGGAVVGHEDLFRFGGDEFVVLLTHLRRSTDAAVVAQKIIDTIRRPFEIKVGQPPAKVSIGVSVGIALIPENGVEAIQLIKSADVAMYKAKERGNRYMFFTRELNRQASNRLFLENGIRSALDEGGFELHFQPIVDPDGIITGAEALIRWQDPKRGFIPPGEFIPVAEDTGLILPLGDWVFEAACDHLRRWSEQGHGNLYLTVNFSGKQFAQEGLVDKLSRALRRTGVDPRNLKLELTESSIMADPEEARKKLVTLKKRFPGIRIAIDDFGTGYSSLSTLSHLPVDVLKIDRFFVINLHRSQNTKIVNTIITLGQSLNLEVVAEGVESWEQLQYLRERGCQAFQGFLFSKPVSSEALAQLLKTTGTPLRLPRA
jgi:PAS domain S-box-containing protein